MENLVSNITNIIFGGMSNFANGIGNAFSYFAQNIFLSVDYSYIFTDESFLLGTYSYQHTSFADIYKVENLTISDLSYLSFLDLVFPRFSELKEYFNIYNLPSSNTIDTFWMENVNQARATIQLISPSSSEDVNSVRSFNSHFPSDYSFVQSGTWSNSHVNLRGPNLNPVYKYKIENENQYYVYKAELVTSYSLNTFGFVTIAFTSLALMFGLSRWVLNLCISLGKRNK